MNLKKIVSIILTAVMICSLSVVTYANPFEGSYQIVGKASATSVKAGDTFTYIITFAEDGSDVVADVNSAEWQVELFYDDAAFEIAGAPTLTQAGLTLDSGLSKSEAGRYYAVIGGPTAGDNFERTFSEANPLLTFTFTVKADATAGAKDFSIGELGICDGADFGELILGSNATDATEAVTVEGDEPDPAPVEVTATQVNGPADELTIGENKYTGLYVFNGTTDKASFKLKAVYADGSKYLRFNGSETISVSNLTTTGSGTVTFKAAVIGVPSSITITKLVIE